ncbi:hypothetical protein BE25_0090 [Staphylococcus phage vB_SepM_BE25]|jgi:hypothetical protein|uniref:DUF7349 domain-containing protein n=1 Tax=Staphylococcus phage phiIBB-SEP1 TaxID=1340769 RepID=W5R9B1_9CAUD|nr:hypothetical protein FDH45_gp012 [Staphylococcus phage phiIBB-SEP1]AXF38319.1 hypothetical protein Quidividi_086 [Staphylococcus phage Quidividi]AXY83972.1 hypothetical protein Terranova_089 [Staphylococcus phage Terranova]MDU0946280.1 hypothetical protein [Anaerococcus vaginalis]MDU5634671.1 hypothetical protein [Staphylococcus epidermidis]MDU7109291.1 hypothetical protein [Clostridium perfringens]WEU70576.1 hypothetical protein BE25_0090 [Staphylococcus phage vB_SepM_BE25]
MLNYTKTNIEMATPYGKVTIDDKGKVNGLTKEQEKEFANLNGFTYTEDKKSQPKKETKEESKKEDTKPKTTTRKTSTRKTTTKKSENK